MRTGFRISSLVPSGLAFDGVRHPFLPMAQSLEPLRAQSVVLFYRVQYVSTGHAVPLTSLGHDARLMPAKYVHPYSKGQKKTSMMPKRLCATGTASIATFGRGHRPSRIRRCARCVGQWSRRIVTPPVVVETGGSGVLARGLAQVVGRVLACRSRWPGLDAARGGRRNDPSSSVAI
jgi:hypothetical protein